jgi:creatinine amidohydrolase
MGDVIRSVALQDLTTQEFQSAMAERVPVVIPLGSIEQHGPHLPLGTDVYIAEGLAWRLGERLPVIVAPPCFYAANSRPRSGGGRAFPGSLGLPLGTLSAVLQSVTSGLVAHGATRLLALNAHFENEASAFEALENALEGQGDRCRALLINWWETVDAADISDWFGGDFPGWEAEHASQLETALMEALRPDLVRTELKADGGPEHARSYDVLPTPPDAIPANGVGSTAKKATRQLGERVANRVTESLYEIVRSEFGLSD